MLFHRIAVSPNRSFLPQHKPTSQRLAHWANAIALAVVRRAGEPEYLWLLSGAAGLEPLDDACAAVNNIRAQAIQSGQHILCL